MDDEHGDDLGREEKEGIVDEEVEKEKDVVGEEKDNKKLDQEERWKEIQERRAYERLHAPSLLFPTKRLENNCKPNFLNFLSI